MASRLRLPNQERSDMSMTLIEHLDELRSRIIKIAVAFVIAAVVAWFFREQLFNALLEPAGNQLDGKLYVTSVTEQLTNDLKMALYAAFVITIPILLYQVWAFIAPAVGEMGKLYTYTLITLASLLFLAGFAFGYLLVLPIGVQFLLTWAPDRYETIITPTYYLGFVTRFLLAFGLVFELPAATYVGAKLGLITAPFLRKYRRHSILVNALAAAAITPTPDPFSMLLMMGPMILMYELSIIVARYANPVSPETELDTLDDGDENDYDDEEDGYYDDEDNR